MATAVILIALIGTTALVEADKKLPACTVLLYHRVMTPNYIATHAIITGPCETQPQHFAITPTTGDSFQRALKFELVAPDTLTNTDPVSVTVAVAFDTALATADHDPWIGITDGTYFNGFVVSDPAYTEPYDGECGRILTKRRSAGRAIRAPQYPSEIKMQFKPTDHWGSAYDDNDVTIGNYKNQLDLTKGLHLELYRDAPYEKYHIRYITVDVSLD